MKTTTRSPRATPRAASGRGEPVGARRRVREGQPALAGDERRLVAGTRRALVAQEFLDPHAPRLPRRVQASDCADACARHRR